MPGFAPLPFKKMTSPISENAYADMKEWVINQFEAVENKTLSKEQFEAFMEMINANKSHWCITECLAEFEQRKESR